MLKPSHLITAFVCWPVGQGTLCIIEMISTFTTKCQCLHMTGRDKILVSRTNIESESLSRSLFVKFYASMDASPVFIWAEIFCMNS